MATLVERTMAALGEQGPIARGLRAGGLRPEVRPGQLAMARAVASAIEDERVLLCEAGTGTGKTLAYLVPALLSGRRVVVSTATKALQEQIYTKDVPLLAEHLAGANVSAALMKGLANYLCRRRLGEALLAPDLPPERARTLARIEHWAKTSETGDRVELSFLRDDDPAWRDVQSGSDTRIGQTCPHFSECFVTQMRRAAEEARLLVVNHHLYLADLALRRANGPRGFRGPGVIPEHDVVVFDEAHQLEDIGTEFFGARISSATIETFARDAKRTLHAARAVVDDKQGQRLVEGIVAASQGFFATMLVHGGPQEARAPLPREAFDDEARARLAKLEAALEGLGAFAALAAKGADEAHREPLAALERRTSVLRDTLGRVVDPERDEVSWIEVRARSCAIGVSPIEVAAVFRRALFGEERSVPSVVLTSATLATGQGALAFVHARRRLGVTDAVEAVVPSPFDYRRNAGAYVPVDLPEPNDPSFLAAAGPRVAELVRASRGGAFVLCASTRNMRALHAYLRDEADLRLPLLCQGERPKTTLLDEFRAARHAVLVATMGFWEGVDVPGHALRLVVIDKLPFAVPTDPVVAARFRAIEEQGRSAFADLSVPEAAIALKQGFGRLIRTTDDRGVVAILDKRLRTKGYGKTLRMALPSASGLHSLDEVRAFFEVVVGVDSLPAGDA